MALSSSRNFSRGNTGLGGSIVGDFDKFATDANPKYHVGYKVEDADGSVYRYSHFGEICASGILVAQDKSENSLADTDNSVIAPASAETTTDGTVGSKFLQLTVASITAGQFEGGKLVVTDDTGESYTYDVKGNTATDDPVSGDIRVELYQALQVALDATSDVSIVSNRWHNLEIATHGTDNILAGVTCTSMAADEWGWVQTEGITGVLQEGTVADGDVLTLSPVTDGAAETFTAAAAANVAEEEIIGTCVDAGDTTGHMVAKISI